MKFFLLSAILFLFPQVFYSSESSSLKSYFSLKTSANIVISKLKFYEDLINNKDSGVSDDCRKNLKRVMIYSLNDFLEIYNSVEAMWAAIESGTFRDTKEYKDLKVPEGEHVVSVMKEYQSDIVSCEKQVKILENCITSSIK